MNTQYTELLKLVAPESILVLTGLLVLALDVGVMRRSPGRTRRLAAALIGVCGCVLAGIWIWQAPVPVGRNAMLLVDNLGNIAKGVLLVLTVLTLLLSIEGEFTDHPGEYCALILLASVGMLFLVGAEDLLMLFVSLELTSLSLYVLAGFSKRELASAEAALKYFLFGSMAAAFTLFGLSLIYGAAGATGLRQIALNLQGRAPDPILLAGLVMAVIGFGFKVAAVPFHLWAPDAYQGAPVPSAAFIASGSKVASFFVLAKVMTVAFAGVEGTAGWMNFTAGWMPVLAMLAACSMVLGNFAAIVQSSVKRLLAYSAVAHAGYMLLGVLAQGEDGISALLYYAGTYGLTTVGAFAVVAAVQGRDGNDGLGAFAGLSRRSPGLAFCMLIFLLSLAGIPPLAGFFGKFYLFTAATKASPPAMGLLWLVVLAIGTSAVSLYYYLKVLKQIYVMDGDAGAGRLRVPWPLMGVILVVAVGVVVLGCLPGLLLEPLREGAGASVFQAGL
jgi:NADH-quinone oxidoreductase subunit N